MAQDILPCITNSECLTKLHVSVLHMSLITIAYRIVTRIAHSVPCATHAFVTARCSLG